MDSFPSRGEGEQIPAEICRMRWKVPFFHPQRQSKEVEPPHQPPWRRSLNKVRRSFWQTSLQGEAFELCLPLEGRGETDSLRESAG